MITDRACRGEAPTTVRKGPDDGLIPPWIIPSLGNGRPQLSRGVNGDVRRDGGGADVLLAASTILVRHGSALPVALDASREPVDGRS